MRAPFRIGEHEIAPGVRRQVELPVARLVTQTQLSLPVIVVHGKRDGPRLWLSAAIHGDELNGTEIIRRVLTKVRAERLRGTLVAVPVVNVFGFVEQSRYLPDRRDLNRSFPGSPRGSLASRLAHLFMTEIVVRCTHGLDLHTGSNNRTNTPQVRANLDDAEVRDCAAAFGAPLMIHAKRLKGSLRAAAARRGLPILVYEAGEPLRFDPPAIRAGTRGVLGVMAHLGMISAPRRPRKVPGLEVRRTRWVRAPCSGIVHLRVGLRDRVKRKQILGTMMDAFGNEIDEVRSSATGLVIGLTVNPLVNRGEAILHIAELSVDTGRPS